MNIKTIIKNNSIIESLTIEQCVYLLDPFYRKRITDPDTKQTVLLLRQHHRTLTALDPTLLTTNPSWLQFFEQYKTYPTCVEKLDVDSLHELSQILRGRVTLAKHLKQLRKHCARRIATLQSYNKRSERAQHNVDILHRKIIKIFNIVDDSRKRIEQLKKTQTKHIQEEIKSIGRIVGLAINDLPSRSTNLYSIDALRNICNHESADNKTAGIVNEHFWSLYGHAGPTIIKMAVEHKDTWNINQLTRAIYGFHQTAKTTKLQNNILSKYHKTNGMIDPQQSYTDVGITQLIYCPRIMPTEVDIRWRLMHESIGAQFDRTPFKPFKHVVTLDQAIEQHPEIENIREFIKC